MRPSDLKLMAMGKKEPLIGVLDQAPVTAEVVRARLGRLLEYGLETRDLDDLEKGHAYLVSTDEARALARGESLDKTAAEHAAVTVSKEHIRKLRATTRHVGKYVELKRSQKEAIFGGGTLNRQTNKISEFLSVIRPQVAELDPHLAPFFGTQGALARHDEVKAALDAAQVEQEVSLSELPLETQKLLTAKGLVLFLIEKCNMVGQIAFEGDAVTRALFNKDLILRARKNGRRNKTPAAATIAG